MRAEAKVQGSDLKDAYYNKLRTLVFFILTISVLAAQSYPTLCNPIDYSPPGSSVDGILQARILEWVSHSLLQEFFLTKESNLHCRWILYHLGHKGSPSSRWQ